MPSTYRIYAFDGGNTIAGPPVIIECDNDGEAISQARCLLDGRDIEVWHGARCVTRLKPDEKA